jgi:biotin transport system substrate-specific component
MSNPLEAIESVRGGIGAWRRSTSIPARLGLMLLGTALMGLAAQIRISLPWTPVPITGQTFGALALGATLGAEAGAGSVLLYLLLGAAGVPWFAAAGSGWAYLAGPTAGYLAGFVLAAYAVGYCHDRFGWARRPPGLMALLLAADMILIFGCGLLWLGHVTGVWGVKLLGLGLLPFIPGELIKVPAAAIITRTITPLQSPSLSPRR